MKYKVMLDFDSIEDLNTFVQSQQGNAPQQPTLTPQGAQIQAEVQAQQPTQAQLRYESKTQAQQAPPAPPVIQQAPPAPQGTAPTSAPIYTLNDLARAAAQISDQNRSQEVTNLLNVFQINGLYALPPEHYGAFAMELRKLGAKF